MTNGKYVIGHSVSLGAMVLAVVGYGAMWFLLKRHNAQRDNLSPEERQRLISEGRKGDAHPDFRYVL